MKAAPALNPRKLSSVFLEYALVITDHTGCTIDIEYISEIDNKNITLVLSPI